MAKVKALWNRRVPFFLGTAEEFGDSDGFDAYPVEVEETTLKNVRDLRALLANMENMFDNMPAPEEAAQEEADNFSAGCRLIFKTRKQDNTRDDYDA